MNIKTEFLKLLLHFLHEEIKISNFNVFLINNAVVRWIYIALHLHLHYF